MKMPIAEVADKYTILLIQIKHNHSIYQDIKSYEQLLAGTQVETLLAINTSIWDIEEIITEELRNQVVDYSSVGAYYSVLRILNLQRVKAKNKIATQHSEPTEMKTY